MYSIEISAITTGMFGLLTAGEWAHFGQWLRQPWLLRLRKANLASNGNIWPLMRGLTRGILGTEHCNAAVEA